MKGMKKNGGQGSHVPASVMSRMEAAASVGTNMKGEHHGITEKKVGKVKGGGGATFKAGPEDGMLIKPAGKGMKP